MKWGERLKPKSLLILGIVSLLICFIPAFGGIVAFFAITLSANALIKRKDYNTKVLVALGLSILAIIIQLIILNIFFFVGIENFSIEKKQPEKIIVQEVIKEPIEEPIEERNDENINETKEEVKEEMNLIPSSLKVEKF